MTHQKVELSMEEYINLRNTVNQLQSKNRQLQLIVDTFVTTLRNSGEI